MVAAPFNKIKIPGKEAGLRKWEENQELFDIFSLKYLLVIPSTEVKSRVSGEINTKKLNLGIVYREVGNESTVRDALKKFTRIKPFQARF